MNWYDDLQGGDISEARTEQHNRDVYTKELLRRQAARQPESPLDNLDADQIRELWLRSTSEKARAAEPQQAREAARQWMAEEPRYKKTPRNAQRMDSVISAMCGTRVPTADDMHAAFNSLHSRGLLEVNESVPTPRREFTHDELENLPLETLRELAEVESRNPGTTRIR